MSQRAMKVIAVNVPRRQCSGMSRLDYQRTIIGYHGCDKALAEKVLLGGEAIASSQNAYDWLGSGIYFWEYGPERALHWATEISKRRPERIKNPAVLGAVIHLGVCFDLLDVRFTTYLRDLYPIFEKTFKDQGEDLPRNEGVRGHSKELVLRKLDCAMLNWAIPFVEARAKRTFHTVRGVFQEGDPAFDGSGIMLKSHIQVVVRDPSAILGYFKPEA
jgi:hypothetical protein